MRISLTLAAGLAVVALLAWGAEALMDAGARRAVARIEIQDRSAADAAAKARDERRACVGAGRLWDTAAGQCQGR